MHSLYNAQFFSGKMLLLRHSHQIRRQTIYHLAKDDTLKMEHKIAHKMKKSNGFVNLFAENAIQYSLLALSVKKSDVNFRYTPPSLRSSKYFSM